MRQTSAVSSGTGITIVPAVLPRPLPKLTVLEFTDPVTLNIADILAAPGSLRFVRYSQAEPKLYLALEQLAIFARSSLEGSEGLPVREGLEDEGSLVLCLEFNAGAYYRCRPNDASVIEAAFLRHLETLVIMREARELAYGSRFRIRFSEKMLSLWRRLADTVTRHPDFLEIGSTDASEYGDS